MHYIFHYVSFHLIKNDKFLQLLKFQSYQIYKIDFTCFIKFKEIHFRLNVQYDNHTISKILQNVYCDIQSSICKLDNILIEFYVKNSIMVFSLNIKYFPFSLFLFSLSKIFPTTYKVM